MSIPGSDPLDPPMYGTIYRLRVDACMAAARRSLNRQFLLFAVLSAVVIAAVNAPALVTKKGSADVALVSGAGALLLVSLLLLGGYVLQVRKLARQVEAFTSFQ